MRRRRGAALAVLQVLDGIGQRLVRPREHHVCWVSDPDYRGNAYHLFRHAVATRPGLHHVWLVGPDTPAGPIAEDFERWGGRDAGSALAVLRRRSVRGYVAFLRSRRTFHTHGIYPTVRGAVGRHVVSLWHGAPIKVIGALNVRSPNPHPTFGTLHLAPSELYRYVIAAAFRAELDEVLLTAFPRCDVLARPHPSAPTAEALRVALGLAPDRPLVLWLPTYRVQVGEDAAVERSFIDDLPPGTIDEVAAEAAAAGCSVVLKLHPYDRLATGPAPTMPAGITLVSDAAWRELGIELYDALAVTDAVMSDVSSVLVDYLATTRPIGVIGFDPATYTRDVVFPVEALVRSARVHDLSDRAALAAFFEVTASGEPIEVDDLSPWLASAPAGEGCERVLGAVGL
jgi:CDP-glycerol glycerophosphotransferase (TagB/SpsB family)